MSVKGIVFLSIFFICTVLGNFLFKHAASSLAPINFNLSTLKAVFTSVSALSGITVYFAAAIAWFVTLSVVPLNIATSVSAFTFVVIILMAFVIFDEPIPLGRFLGIGMIASGFFVVAWNS